MAQNFFWYELMTSDVAGAKAFYGDVVGWDMQAFPGMDYTVLAVGQRGVAGLMKLPADYAEHGGKPAWIGYIYAADVDAAVEKLKAAGGTVHRAPAAIPNVGRFASVADPQGGELRADDA